MTNILPGSRTENIVVQEVGQDLLIYDLLSHKAFNLNETSRIIFEACDGKTSFEDLKTKYKFTDDLVYFALDELNRLDLITGDYESKFESVSRREVIRKIGLASMIAIPVIASITVPRATQAQSLLPNGGACQTGTQCASGSCVSINGDLLCCKQSTATHGPGEFIGCSVNFIDCGSNGNFSCCSGRASEGSQGGRCSQQQRECICS